MKVGNFTVTLPLGIFEGWHQTKSQPSSPTYLHTITKDKFIDAAERLFFFTQLFTFVKNKTHGIKHNKPNYYPGCTLETRRRAYNHGSHPHSLLLEDYLLLIKAFFLIVVVLFVSFTYCSIFKKGALALLSS